MRRALLAVWAAAASAASFAAMGGARGGSPRLDPNAPFFVVATHPTRRQHVLPDLSDPGLNNVFTIVFSRSVHRADLLDETNPVNGLSAKAAFVDESGAPVPATASVRANVLTLDPFDARTPVLRQGRYALRLRRSLRSAGGSALNHGERGFSTMFFVGYVPPLLLRVSPRPGAALGRRQAIVVRFDESVLLASAAAAIRLEDRRTVPPTPIPSDVRLARDLRDVVVSPSAPFPRGARIALVLAGRGASTDPSATVLRCEVFGSYRGSTGGPEWIVDADAAARIGTRHVAVDPDAGEVVATYRAGKVAGR